MIELFYYTYNFEFQLIFAVLTIVVIAIFNLIFESGLLKFNANIILAAIIFFALILTDKDNSFKAFYFASYLLTAFLSFLISYNNQKHNQSLKKTILEQEMILDTIDLQVWYLKDEERYGKANRAHAEFLGIAKEKIEDKKINYFLSENEAEICKTGNRRVFQEKKKITIEERAKNYKGVEKTLLITKSPKLDKSEEVEYVVCAAKDITERREQKDKLKLQYKFQKKLAEISSELVNVNLENIDQKLDQSLKNIGEFFAIDQSSIYKLVEGEQYFKKTHSCSADSFTESEIKTKKLAEESYWLLEKFKNKKIIKLDELKNLAPKADSDVVRKLFKSQSIKSAVIIPIVINDKLFGFFLFSSLKKKRDFKEKELDLLQILTDVVRRAISKNKDEKRIEKLTYYDSLTGIYNRRFFEEEMKRLDTKRKIPISIIIADINGLKIINDSYGHQKGDEVLKKAARVLQTSLRSKDILSRQGGDEFAILLPNTGEKEVENIIGRIKVNIAETNKGELYLSIALGAATKNNFEEDIKLVLKKADDNMYKNKLSESKSSKSNIVHGLLNALDAKSNETKEHAVRMTKLAFDFGEKLGLSNSELNRLSLLATLHDIGKTNIDEKILNKEAKLNDKEWEIVKKHSEQGYKIATSSEEFSLVAEDIFAHHERWDGSGYPRNLKGEEIPYLARIITIIDSYDVMTNNRSYSDTISKKEALAEISHCAGSQFDPKLAKVFIEMMEEEQK